MTEHGFDDFDVVPVPAVIADEPLEDRQDLLIVFAPHGGQDLFVHVE
jgi:hypothetical protein